MTKIQTYDELEIDERPRICGGAVFQKFLKGKCGSSPRKNESPVLTSSSSYTSSQASSMSLSNIYDPSKTHFCMPRQMEGAGTIAAETKDCSKLNFKLQVEEHVDLYANHDDDQADFFFPKNMGKTDFYAEDRARSHSIINFNPLVVNDLKTKHMQSTEEKRISGGKNSTFEQSTNEMNIPRNESVPEVTTSFRNEFEQSIKTPHNEFMIQKTEAKAESEDANKNENVDTAWNKLQLVGSKHKKNEDKEIYESRAHVLRKEMSSFRKELNAVKRSLPNQFDTNHFTDLSDDRNEVPKSGDVLPRHKSNAFNKLLPDQLRSNQNSDQGDAWNVNAFALISSKEASKTSEKKHKRSVSFDRKYFKNDWNLNFQDQENLNKIEQSHSEEKTLSLKCKDHDMMQRKNSCPVFETNESFPECPDMAFDQGFNPEEIEINETTTSPEEIERIGHSNSCDKALEPIAMSSKRSQESEKVWAQNFENSSKSSDKQGNIEGNRFPTKTNHKVQQENKEDNRVPTKTNNKVQQENIEVNRVPTTNYKEDMNLVKMLMKKYGENFDKRMKVEKARRIIDAPTDAWFHRHAEGMLRKSEKPLTPKSYNSYNPTQINNTTTEESLRPKNNPSREMAVHTSLMKNNRVHFETQSLDTLTEKSSLNDAKISSRKIDTISDEYHHNKNALVSDRPAQSPGKLSAKIKFWEEKKI